MEDMIPLVAIIANVIMVVLIVYFVTRTRQRRAELQVEMQSRLIDRFSSPAELVQFLHSDAGRKFMTGVEVSSTQATRNKLMSGFNRAIILLCLAAAFLFIAIFNGEEDAYVVMALLAALGLGFLIATFVSYKLAGKLMSDAGREP
jgi:ABC-type transport system involved in cytochrome bd biosynthesis fused ATPase/permease subunit